MNNELLLKNNEKENIDIDLIDLYYEENILPLIKENNISELNNYLIFKNKEKKILFKDDYWNFKEITNNPKSINIKFKLNDMQLKNEFKIIMLSILILHRNKYKDLRTCRN